MAWMMLISWSRYRGKNKKKGKQPRYFVRLGRYEKGVFDQDVLREGKFGRFAKLNN